MLHYLDKACICGTNRGDKIPDKMTYVLTVSDFEILMKSCSIESRNDPSQKSEVVHETKFSLKISYSTHACLAQLDQHQTCKSVMVSVVSSNPTGGNFEPF